MFSRAAPQAMAGCSPVKSIMQKWHTASLVQLLAPHRPLTPLQDGKTLAAQLERADCARESDYSSWHSRRSRERERARTAAQLKKAAAEGPSRAVAPPPSASQVLPRPRAPLNSRWLHLYVGWISASPRPDSRHRARHAHAAAHAQSLRTASAPPVRLSSLTGSTTTHCQPLPRPPLAPSPSVASHIFSAHRLGAPRSPLSGPAEYRLTAPAAPLHPPP